jgi:hypothetical protein
MRETSTKAGEQGRGDGDCAFSFGVRELREAQNSQGAKATQGTHTPQLALEDRHLKIKGESYGIDPYNTSGTFHHWARVGRR